MRVIVATLDVRALASYYRAGVVVRFPIVSMSGGHGRPRPETWRSSEPSSTTLADIAAIEHAVIGYPRREDYPWLIANREAYLYRRDGKSIGFSFLSPSGQGPIAALDPPDQVPILLHVEGRAHALGIDGLSFEVPMINEVAMRHLLSRGFKLEPPLTLFMSNVAFGQFDRFVAFGPGIVF